LGTQLLLLGVFPLYLIHFILSFSPGLFLAVFVIQNQKIDRFYIVLLSILISALIGYLTFWVYLLNQYAGIGLSSLIVLASIYCFASPKLRLFLKNQLTADIVFPLLLIFFVGLFYLSILGIFGSSEVPLETLVRTTFFHGFPHDNSLPRIFAEKLYAGRDPRDLGAGWLSSDRPPLQTGLTLVQRPIMAFGAKVHYPILATIAQCSWIASVWSLCRAIRLSGKQIALVLAFSIFSGFFLFNSIYVWPKLLAAALAVFAFSLLLQAVCESRRPTSTEFVLAVVAAAAALLSHGGVIFTLPAFALLLVKPQSFPGIRFILIGCAVFGLLIAPWTAYQKFYNPPGDRLVKWHLAGVSEIDTRSSWQAISDSYHNISIEQIASNKWQNFKVLFGKQSSDKDPFYRRRETEFFYTFKGLGILNLGWLILLLAPLAKVPLTKRIHRFNNLLKLASNELKAARLMLGVSLVSLLFWVMVMFGPATTIIHQGSYATMMLLFTGLALLISGLTRFLTYFLLSLQIISFAVIWVFTIPPIALNAPPPGLNVGMMALAIAALVGIIKILHRLSHQKFTQVEP
jgi:hypothetical protein